MAVGVIAAAVVVSQFAPPGYAPANQRRAVQPIILTGHDFATTVKAGLTVSPGTVGQNNFSASVSDYDTGQPVDATSVDLRFSYPSNATVGGSELPLKRTGQMWQATGSNLSLLGRWDVQMVVQEPTSSADIAFQLTTRLPQQQVSVSQGNPTLYTVSLAGGNTLQMYLDHGKPGPDTVHFTFFQPSGSELAISSASATALTPQGSLKHLKLIRFDKGHFASNVTLTLGKWTFLIDGVAGSTTYSGYMQQDI